MNKKLPFTASHPLLTQGLLQLDAAVASFAARYMHCSDTCSDKHKKNIRFIASASLQYTPITYHRQLQWPCHYSEQIDRLESLPWRSA